MLKVLHIYKTSYPKSFGGVETVIESLSNKLNNKFIKSDILCVGDKNLEEEYNGKKIYLLKETLEISSCPFSMSMFIKFQNIIKHYDILHYHYPWPFADLLHLLFARNKKTIVTYHSDIVKQKFLMKLYAPIEQMFLNNVNLIVATSPQYVNSSPNLKKFSDKTEIIPIGIQPKQEDSTSTLSQKLPDKFFCFIGVLRYYKGLHLAIKALKGTKHKLIIIGDGPEKENLELLTNKLSLSNQVTFLGKLPEDQKIYVLKRALALILPSHLRSEAFGTVLLEAAYFNKPLISCKIDTGTEFVNIDGETGCCVEPTARALKGAMDKLSEHKFNKLASTNAKKRFEKLFTVDIMANKYLKLYQKLCS